MKRAILIASVAAAALALAALAHGAASPQTKTHQFRCTDKNTSLYFLVYESGGKNKGGGTYRVEKQRGGGVGAEAGAGGARAEHAGGTTPHTSFSPPTTPQKKKNEK